MGAPHLQECIQRLKGTQIPAKGARKLGVDFRCQVIIGNAIGDFFAPAASLIVKVDGEPLSSPNLSTFAERFVASIQRECLNHIIPLGEAPLRWVVREFVEHYYAKVSAIGRSTPTPCPRTTMVRSDVVRGLEGS